MTAAWTLSALRSVDLSNPIPTGEGLDPMWRLIAPALRPLFVAPRGDSQIAVGPVGDDVPKEETDD